MPPKKKGTTAAAKKGAAKAEGEENEYQEVQAAVQSSEQNQVGSLPQVEVPQVIQVVEAANSHQVADNNQAEQQDALNIASVQLGVQQGEDLLHSHNEIDISGVQGLSEQEKKQLRMARFNPSAPKATLILGGNNPVMSTVEAALRKKQEEEKRLARAQKFGLVTEETMQQKLQQRAVKFGLAEPKIRTVTSTGNQGKPAQAKAESKFAAKALKLGFALPSDDDEKRKARAERFGVSSADDEQEKLKKRQDRFGGGSSYNLANSGRIIINSGGPTRRVKEI